MLNSSHLRVNDKCNKMSSNITQVTKNYKFPSSCASLIIFGPICCFTTRHDEHPVRLIENRDCFWACNFIIKTLSPASHFRPVGARGRPRIPEAMLNSLGEPLLWWRPWGPGGAPVASLEPQLVRLLVVWLRFCPGISERATSCSLYFIQEQCE